MGAQKGERESEHDTNNIKQTFKWNCVVKFNLDQNKNEK